MAEGEDLIRMTVSIDISQYHKETPLKILHDAVRVKNAHLIQIDSEYGTKYVLQHYDTIILEVVNNEVLLIKPNISKSSSRAINQAFEYLNMSHTAKDYKKRSISN